VVHSGSRTEGKEPCARRKKYLREINALTPDNKSRTGQRNRSDKRTRRQVNSFMRQKKGEGLKELRVAKCLNALGGGKGQGLGSVEIGGDRSQDNGITRQTDRVSRNQTQNPLSDVDGPGVWRPSPVGKIRVKKPDRRAAGDNEVTRVK